MFTPKRLNELTIVAASLLFAVLPLSGCQISDQPEPGESKKPPPFKPAKQYTLRGYIDKDGKFAIKPQFVTASSFSEGLAHVCDPRGSYIDKTGRFVIPTTYYVGGDFHEGLAWAAVPKKNWAEVNRPGDQLLYGFIDKTGKFVIQPKYRLVGDFSEGYALVMPQGSQTVGFIDRTGKMVIEPRFAINVDSPYEELPHFKHGTAHVTGENSHTSFYINKSGKVLDRATTEKISKELSLDEEGYKSLCLSEHYGYENRAGKQVIACKYDKVFPFHDGLAQVRLSGKRFEFIDKTGNVVFGPTTKYEYGSFHEGRCLYRERHDSDYTEAADEDWSHPTAEQVRGVKVEFPHGNWGYIDKAGKPVVTPQFASADDFSEGLAVVEAPVSREEVEKIKLPFDYTIENNSLVFPMKFTDDDDEKVSSGEKKQ